MAKKPGFLDKLKKGKAASKEEETLKKGKAVVEDDEEEEEEEETPKKSSKTLLKKGKKPAPVVEDDEEEEDDDSEEEDSEETDDDSEEEEEETPKKSSKKILPLKKGKKPAPVVEDDEEEEEDEDNSEEEEEEEEETPKKSSKKAVAPVKKVAKKAKPSDDEEEEEESNGGKPLFGGKTKKAATLRTPKEGATMPRENIISMIAEKLDCTKAEAKTALTGIEEVLKEVGKNYSFRFMDSNFRRRIVNTRDYKGAGGLTERVSSDVAAMTTRVESHVSLKGEVTYDRRTVRGVGEGDDFREGNMVNGKFVSGTWDEEAKVFSPAEKKIKKAKK
jgi:hypothetical protein